jgi:acyl-coenzyme A synthetase/AMP-(fatty) acid ligase
MKIIGTASDNTNWKKNGLTDGKLTVLYQDIPGVFDRIKKNFADTGIGVGDVLSLELENTVPGALTLLYLLEEGYNFVLLSPGLQKQLPGTGQSFPGLCRYRIRTEKPGLNPTEFLNIVKNEKWRKEYETTDQEPKVYLRTSGSTGTPKMAVHPHGKLLGNILNCIDRLHLTSDDRIAIPVPISHMYGLGAAFLPAAAAGASVDLQKGANLLRYLQREKEFNPNIVFLTPIFSETMVKGRRSRRPYKLTVVAGDRMRGEIFTQYEAAFGSLVQLYGSTEMGAIAAANPDDPVNVRAATVGKPMPDVQVRLEKVQARSSNEEKEDIGILWCNHKYGFDGYVDENGKPIEQEKEKSGNWFCTKDLGRFLHEGCLEVLGRYDHSVNRDGILVFFSNLENAIATIEGIETAAVVSSGESQRGKRIIAFCVMHKGVKKSENEIRASCFDILARHEVPDNIFIIDSFPLLPNGKVDRQKLAGMAGNEVPGLLNK